MMRIGKQGLRLLSILLCIVTLFSSTGFAIASQMLDIQREPDAEPTSVSDDIVPMAASDYTLEIQNTLIGTVDKSNGDVFTFQITCPTGVTAINNTVAVTGQDSGTFDLSFSEAGTYTVQISCQTGDIQNVVSDERVLEIPLTVTGSSGSYTVVEGTRVYKLNGTKAGVQTSFVTKYSEGFTWPDSVKRQAQKIMDGMTLEEKVGQLFILHYPGDGSGSTTQATNIVNTYHPGAFIVFAAMFKNNTPSGVLGKVNAAQTASKADTGIPLFFSVDEEGGNVVRISDKTAYNHSKFESQLAMADKGAEAIEADAVDKANFLLSLGMNVNHAPVADVSGPGGYMYSRQRVYGGDALKVAEYVAASVRGHESVDGIGTSIKHFPGYGSTSSNTHNGAAVNNLPRGDFDYGDLLPFYEGIAAGGKAVMITHNIINCIDTEMPASLSADVISVLRNEMNFDGVLMTDDLNMGAVTEAVGAGNGALACLQAGVDMPMCSDPDAQVPKVLAAVNNGVLPLSRVEKSCLRVLCWKIDMGLIAPEEEPDPSGVDKTELTKAISSATTAQGTAVESTDGSNVGEGTKWVTAAEMKALADAIDAAKAVRDNVSASVDDVSTAVAALNAAVDAFNAAKKDGTQGPDPEAEYTDNAGKVQSGTFEDMWALAVANGGTVKMLQDIDTAGDKTVDTQNVTLNLNYHKIHFTSGTNGFIVDKGKALTITDAVQPTETVEENTQSTETAAYNDVRRELVYYTRQDDGITRNKHTVDMDSCGMITGANTGIMLEVLNGTLNIEGGVFSHKVRAIEAVNNKNNVVNMNGGAVVNCGVSQGGTTVNGSGLGVYGGGTLNINGGYIAGNEATTRGGGIIIDSGALNINGGVLAVNKTKANGGAVYLNGKNAVCTITGGIFSGNSSGSHGGAVIALSTPLTVNQAEGKTLQFVENTATYGGAIDCYKASWVSGDATLGITGGQFFGNSASKTGGAIGHGSESLSGKNMSISGATFIDNAAGTDGGAIFANSVASVNINGNTIENNRASSNGGGIAVTGTTTAEITDTSALNNTAGGKGGGIYYAGSSAQLKLGGRIRVVGNKVADANNNLYLAASKTVQLKSILDGNSTVRITTETLPADSSPVVVGTAATSDGIYLKNSSGMFASDSKNYSIRFREENKDLVLSLGDGSHDDSYVEVNGILFQYYVNLKQVAFSGDSSRRVVILDTSGAFKPQNGVGYESNPAGTGNRIRYLYLNEDGSVVEDDILTPVFSSVDTTVYESLANMNRFLDCQGYYYPNEVWVARTGEYGLSTNREDFTIYPYSESLNITSDPDAATDANTIFVEQGSVVRFVANSAEATVDIPAVFYDYDVSDGSVYTSQADATSQTNPHAVTEELPGNKYVKVNRQGINHPDNYTDETKAKFGFGNANLGSGLENETTPGTSGWAFSINKANRKAWGDTNNFKYVYFGMVKGFDETTGKIIYNDQVCVPNLFDDGDAVGKTAITGHDVIFDYKNGQFTMDAVSGTNATNLSVFGHPGIYDGVQNSTVIWSNNFWPLDDMGTFGTEGHDVKFGASNHTIYNEKTNPAKLPVSDDALNHNAYFGMQFALSFTLDNDYIGPLEYYFFGDDDMWVFLDDQLVCDLGGVHQSAGEYVNLWDYLEKETSGKHTLRFYFTERGASGSTCWMRLNVPNLKAATDEVVSYPGSLKIEKTVEGMETAEAFEFMVDIILLDESQAPLNGEYLYTGVQYGVNCEGRIKSGDTVSLANGDYIIIKDLPNGAQYVVTEVDNPNFEAAQQSMTGTIRFAQSTASFVNTATASTLHISKCVEGDVADPTKFEFIVTLTDGAGNPVSGVLSDGTVFASGSSIQLASGETIAIRGLPLGTQYEIREVLAGDSQYELVSSEGSAGSITSFAGASAVFVNKKVAWMPLMPLTGGIGIDVVYLYGFGCLTVAMALQFYKKKRQMPGRQPGSLDKNHPGLH